LQQPALKTWAGKEDNVHATQAALLDRAKANSSATVE